MLIPKNPSHIAYPPALQKHPFDKGKISAYLVVLQKNGTLQREYCFREILAVCIKPPAVDGCIYTHRASSSLCYIEVDEKYYFYIVADAV